MSDFLMAQGLKAMEPVTYYGTVRGSQRALEALKAIGIDMQPIPRLSGIVCKVDPAVNVRGVLNAFQGECCVELYGLPNSFVPTNKVVARDRALDQEPGDAVFAYELYLLYQIHSGNQDVDLQREVQRAEIALEKLGVFPLAVTDEDGEAPSFH
jgi:hypothetical protein